MAINVIDQGANQQMATAINQAAISIAPDKIRDKSDDTKTATTTEDAVSRMLGAENSGKEGMEVLKSLIAKVASGGLVLTDNLIGNKVGVDHFEKDGVAKKDEEGGDTVLVTTSPIAKKLAKNIVNRINLPFQLNSDARHQAENLVEQYSAAYVEFISDNKPKTKERLKNLEAALKEKGLSNDRIFSIQKEIRSAMRADLSLKIKEGLLMRELSNSKLESTFCEHGTRAVVDEALGSNKFGGVDDFGGHSKGIQGFVDKSIEQVKEEMQKFAFEELESTLINKLVKKDHSEKEINKLLKLCAKSGLDLTEWANNVWPDKKIHLGFNLIDVPTSQTGNMVNTNTDNPGRGSKQEQEYSYDENDEKELLSNRLRAVYMKRFMKGDLRTQLTTSFEVRKLENGLFRMGIHIEDIDKIKFESEVLAKSRLMEMLKETLLEKATLFSLEGSAYKLVGRKLKSILRNASKLGIKINGDELENMQFAANSRMLDVVRRQIEVYESIAQKNKDPMLKKEIDNMKQLEERLSKEMASGGKDLVISSVAEEENSRSEIA